MASNSAKDEDLFLKRMTRWNSYQREDENWKWKGRPNHRNLTVKAALNNDKLKHKVNNDSISMKEVERNLEILANYIRDNPDPQDSDNESSIESNISTDNNNNNNNNNDNNTTYVDNKVSNKIKVPSAKVKKHDVIKLTDCLKIKKDLRNKFTVKKDDNTKTNDMNALDLVENVNDVENHNSIVLLDSNTREVDVVMSPKSRNSVVVVIDSIPSSSYCNKTLSMIDKVRLHNVLRMKVIQHQNPQQIVLPNIASSELIDLNANNRPFMSPSPILFDESTLSTNAEKANIENNDKRKITKSRFDYLKNKYLGPPDYVNDDIILKVKKKSTKRKKEKSLKKLMIQAQDDSNLGFPYNFYANNFDSDHVTSVKLPTQYDERKVYTPSNKFEVKARPVSSPSLPHIKKGTKDTTYTSNKSILINKAKSNKKLEMNKNKDSLKLSDEIKHTDMNIDKRVNAVKSMVKDNLEEANIKLNTNFSSQNVQLPIASDFIGDNNFNINTLISKEYNSNSLSPGGSSIFYISDSEDDMSTVADIGSFSRSVDLNYKNEEVNQQNVVSSGGIEVITSSMNSPNTKNTFVDSNSSIKIDVKEPLAGVTFMNNVLQEKDMLSNLSELKGTVSVLSPTINSKINYNKSPRVTPTSNNDYVETKLQMSTNQSNQVCTDYGYRKHMTTTVTPNRYDIPAKCSSSNISSFVTPTSTRFFDVSSTSDKGRFRVNDAREFDTDSLFRRPDILNNYVTVLFGKKRSNGETKVISLLFDRDEFKTELDAYNWWLNNKDRFNV
jgi:hypothetical protein